MTSEEEDKAMTVQEAKRRKAEIEARYAHLVVDLLRADNGQPFSPTRENQDRAEYGIGVYDVQARQLRYEEW